MFLSPSKPVVGRSSVIIRKPAEEVFRFIGENFFENYPKWSPEVKNLKALSDGPVRVGTLARQVRVDFGYRSESDFRVLEFQKYQRFVCAGGGHVGDVLRMSAFRCVYDLKEAPFSESCTCVAFKFEIPELDFMMRPFEVITHHHFRHADRGGAPDFRAALPRSAISESTCSWNGLICSA
jgi:hypothetical protein